MAVNILKTRKNGDETNLTGKRNLVKNKIVEAREEARRILEDANQRAAEIIRSAEQKAEIISETAYREATEKAVAEFSEIIAAAYEKRERVLIEIEQDVLRLSVKLAEKIIGRELETRRETISDMVSTALRHVRQQERLIVRVNPADLPQLQDFKTSHNYSGRANFIDFEPDPKITSGGCIIESEVGTVDARLETQMKILERVLLNQAKTDSESGS